MQYGYLEGHVRFSPEERALAVEALTESGMMEMAEVLGSISIRKEIPPRPMSLIVDCVKKMRETGREDAQYFVDSYEALD